MAEKDVATWSWKPIGSFEIDLKIGDEQLVTNIDQDQRREVAMSLARLADAVAGSGRTLIWRWDDGAEQNLDGDTILDREHPQQTLNEDTGWWRFGAEVIAHAAKDGEIVIRQVKGCDSLPMVGDVIDVMVLVDRA